MSTSWDNSPDPIVSMEEYARYIKEGLMRAPEPVVYILPNSTRGHMVAQFMDRNGIQYKIHDNTVDKTSV